jgi:hypothetical protein
VLNSPKTVLDAAGQPTAPDDDSIKQDSYLISGIIPDTALPELPKQSLCSGTVI